MKTSPTNFRDTFLEGVLDLIWRQWTTLGVSGHGGRESRMIDPDALLLATCVFGRYEPRLFDGMLDWLGVNGWCVNVQRVRSLLKRYPCGAERVLACVGSLLAKGAETAKWGRLSLAGERSGAGGQLEPLFYLADGRPQPMFGAPEPRFAAYGLHRGALELRNLAQPAKPEVPANLVYRLRAFFGVNARADIAAYLLTHEEGHPPEMARQMAYFPKTTQMTLSEMALSGNVESVRRGREKHYRLVRSEWAMLLPKAEGATEWPEWVGWPQFFAAMSAIWELLRNRELPKASSALQASEWQKLMSRIQPLLAEGGFDLGAANLRGLTGANYVEAVQREIGRCLSGKGS